MVKGINAFVSVGSRCALRFGEQSARPKVGCEDTAFHVFTRVDDNHLNSLIRFRVFCSGPKKKHPGPESPPALNFLPLPHSRQADTAGLEIHMAFVVSARKYRPVRFDEVVGQAHVSQTLKKALQTDHLAHAFLFCGPRGVGKTTCARILAKVLNCKDLTADYEPCGKCDSCLSFSENASFNIMELDAASNNSVDHIRALVEQVRFQPQQGKYKVFIIDEVHMLSQSAFNAFLKTLEEPPPYAVFILATTEKHKIIPTILSRCQIFDFKRIQIKDIVDHLHGICRQEGIEADRDALHIIAQKADGALRDALSIFDRITSFTGKKITYEDVITNLNVLDYDYYFRFTDALLTEDLRQTMLIFDEVLRNGFDGDLFVNGLAEHLRNLLVCKDGDTLGLLEVGDSLKDRYRQQAVIAPTSFILTALNLCNQCDIHYKTARNKRLHVELALVKMCFIGQAMELATGNAPAVGAEKKTADLSTAAPPVQAKPIPESPAADSPYPVAGTVQAVNEPQSGFSAANEAVNLAEKDIPAEVPVKKDGPAQAPPVADLSLSPLRKPTNGSLPTLQSLDSLHAEIEEAEANDPLQRETELTQDMLLETWGEYIESIDNGSVKTILKGANVVLEAEHVKTVVGSALAESIVRQETGLMEFLRKKLHAPLLAMNLVLDPSRPNAAPAKPKRMTENEKYWAMVAQNPLVSDLRKRLDLNFENE